MKEIKAFDEEQAKYLLALLGKNPEQSWIRCLKQWKTPPGTGADTQRLELKPDANAYFITGNGDPANGTTVNDNDIKSCPALFVEWDNKPVAWQLNAWQEFGLPEPSISVSSGSKSIHCYWILNEPMAPEAWCKLIKRLIEHCGADPANKNPSRLMRLPGSIYYDKETGEATNRCEIVSTCDRRYSVSEIEECLPPVLPTPTPRAAASTRFAASNKEWEPRTEAELIDALRQVPVFEHDQGRREELLGLAFRLTAEIGAERGLQLMQEHSPAVKDLASYFKTQPTQINAGSIWPFLREHYNVDISRTSQKQVTAKAEGFAPAPTKAKQLTFEERWELVELHAAELGVSDWPAMKAIASLSSKASNLDVHRLNQRQLEQLLEQAQRQLRAKSEPISPGGKFTVTSTPFAVDGLFRHALNLLVGQSGAGKSRLIAACMAAWLRGDQTWLKRNLNGIKAAHRHALIVGPDQSLEDWHLTLAPVGLSWLADPNDPTTVQIHDRLTLYGLETGIQLDADGLNTIRRWVDAHPGGMVLIDSLSACLPAGVDEDKSSAAAPIHKLQEALGDAWGVLTHHTRKSAGKEGNLGVGAGRGSGAIDAAVSRVIGLGLIYKVENGAMVAQESDPRRELLSTKRGGKTEHLIISSDASGFWDVHGDAEALKAQERKERTINNLTEMQSNVLNVIKLLKNWITIKEIIEALGEVYESKNSFAANIRKIVKRLETLGLIKSMRVGGSCSYQIAETKPQQGESRCETALTHEFEMTSSLSSPVALQGESLAHLLAHQGVPTGSPGAPHPLHGELCELVELISEPHSEPPRTTAAQQVSQVSHVTMEPSTAFTFLLGDSVELLTEEQQMQSDWQISAIQGNTIRITKCDSGEVRDVNCVDLIYMPF